MKLDENEPKIKNEIIAAIGLMTQLGLTMVVCILIGVMVGKYLDKWLGTSPWCLVIFSFLGGGAAIKALYDIVIKKWNDKK